MRMIGYVSDAGFSVNLSHPVPAVWRALTEPALLSSWLAPTDLVPAPGATGHVSPAPWAPDLPAPFDVDVIEVAVWHRLRMRWRAPGWTGEVVWAVTPHPGGCSVTVTRSGAIPSIGAASVDPCEDLFRRRLPSALSRATAAGRARHRRVGTRAVWQLVRRLAALPDEWRRCVLSAAGAAILIVLVASALGLVLL